MSWLICLRAIAYTLAGASAFWSVLIAALFCRHAVEEHARERSGKDGREGLRCIRGGKAS